MVDALAIAEKAKYKKAWEHDDYRNVAPGENLVVPFISIVQPKDEASINDYGAGTGRASFFFRLGGYDIRMFDIADNCLDTHVAKIMSDRLTVANLWDLPQDTPIAEYGYCTDVMEHIPTDKVEAVIDNIANTCQRCFFHICFHEDHFGDVLGTELHLTVKPYVWWLEKLRARGRVIDARDLIWNGLYCVEFGS